MRKTKREENFNVVRAPSIESRIGRMRWAACTMRSTQTINSPSKCKCASEDTESTEQPHSVSQSIEWNSCATTTTTPSGTRNSRQQRQQQQQQKKSTSSNWKSFQRPKRNRNITEWRKIWKEKRLKFVSVPNEFGIYTLYIEKTTTADHNDVDTTDIVSTTTCTKEKERKIEKKIQPNERNGRTNETKTNEWTNER